MKAEHLLLYSDNLVKLREVIKKRLKAIGKSQNELCIATGVSGSTLARWLGSLPNTATLLKLEEQLAAWEKSKIRAILRQSSKSRIEKPKARA